MAKQLMIKPEKCIGCRTCEVICSWNKAKNFNPRNSAVSIINYEEVVISVPMMCLQCEEACCVKVCPVGAMYKDENGVVKTDAAKCIVCKMCVNACPLGNVTFSQGNRKIVKCDLCGGDPGCAKYCPAGCIVYTGEEDGLGRKKAAAFSLRNVFGVQEAAK
ncbi:MAG: 4Fe-4S dicluster domain-containing protein [Treponema sp.]|jgi:Fe-S-cluster-containing hydrogenase component 2|nr:4Fe-4S dicluster domain-containing protein [Treponema sp.]